MNYQKIYDEIINNAKSRGLNKKPLNYYTEKHHIIPRCMNGTNDKNNLILLTAKEHFVCHHLLWKIHKLNKLIWAFHNMCKCKNKYQNERTVKLSANEYKTLRECISIIISENNKKRIWTNESKLKISEKAKHQKHSNERRINQSNRQNGRIWLCVSKPCIINNITYDSASLAAKCLGLTVKAVRYKLRSSKDKYKNWIYKKV